MNTRALTFALASASLLASAPAFAQVVTAAQDEMIPPAAVQMDNVPYGVSGGSDGQYTESGTYYNNAPVYTKTFNGTTWSLYKRTNGAWHVDFNAVSEDWDGTVAYTSSAQSFPWSNIDWNNEVVSFRTVKVNLQGFVYSQYGSTGDYALTGQIYNNAPVYSRTQGGTTWSLYKRADGKWYVDFNAVSEAWDGTVAYSNATSFPWNATWNTASAFATNTKIVYLYNTSYANLGSAGEYVFSGQTYNNAPVYTRLVAGSTWSLYKRATGIWVLDFNAVSEDWDGTVNYTNSAQSTPYAGAVSGSWANGVVAFRTARVTLAGSAYAGIGSAGSYLFSGQIYNNAPVYTRTHGGTTWSLYKRANGRWHLDFNAVSEDWDGTVNQSNAVMDLPFTTAGWNNGTMQVVDQFAD